jgi:hypothetical protein
MYFYYVYVFLLLRMFRSVNCVSLCCSVYCLCVNVYCAVLYCIVLCYAVLCCAVLCCTVLYYCHRVSPQLWLTSISYHISHHISPYIISPYSSNIKNSWMSRQGQGALLVHRKSRPPPDPTQPPVYWLRLLERESDPCQASQ